MRRRHRVATRRSHRQRDGGPRESLPWPPVADEVRAAQAKAFTPVSSADSAHSRVACPGSVAYAFTPVRESSSGSRLGDVAVLAVHPAEAHQLRRRRGPDLGGRALLRRLEQVGVQDVAVLVDPPALDHLLLGQVPLEGREDAARVQGERPYARVPAEPVELHGEQHVRRLRLPVRPPLVVAGAPVHVVPADAGGVVAGGGDRHDPRPARCDHRPQPVDQGEVAEVVGRELSLPAGADPRLGAGHDARAVDDDVDGASGGEEPLGEGPHALQVTEVQLVRLDAVDALQGLAGGLRAPRRDHHVGARAGQCPGRLQTDARIAAGDDRELAGEVDPLQDLVGGALGAETRTDLVLCSAHVLNATNWSGLQVKRTRHPWPAVGDGGGEGKGKAPTGRGNRGRGRLWVGTDGGRLSAKRSTGLQPNDRPCGQKVRPGDTVPSAPTSRSTGNYRSVFPGVSEPTVMCVTPRRASGASWPRRADRPRPRW